MSNLPWFPLPLSVQAQYTRTIHKLEKDKRKRDLKMMEIVNYLVVNPCSSTHMIAAGMGKTDVLVSSHLQNLEWKGLVTYELKKSPRRETMIKFWSAT